MKKLIFFIIACVVCVAFSSCTTTHSFSFSAGSTENPNIIFKDSTNLVIPKR